MSSQAIAELNDDIQAGLFFARKNVKRSAYDIAASKRIIIPTYPSVKV